MGTERHSTDGDLIALLDGEQGSSQREIEAHVDSCTVCSGRLARLQQLSARLSQALHALELPATDRARPLPSPRATVREIRQPRARLFLSRASTRAAAAVLLLAGVAAASPARGWIIDRIMARRAERAPRAPDTLPSVPTPAAEQSPGSIVRFASESDELLVRFAVRPTAGELVVAGGDEPRSSAQILSNGRGEAFLVLPSELRIRNAVGSVANYRLVLAPTVRRVRVLVDDTDGGVIATIDFIPGAMRTIELGPPGGRR